MKKIISLFARNYDGDRLVRNEVVPGAEWVLAGEGVATRKWDGTACMVSNGVLWKRYDVKKGRSQPGGWVPAQEADPVTGHHPGWVAVTDGPEDKWHREAWNETKRALNLVGPLPEGTYELIGPKIQGNPEKVEQHILVPHGKETMIAPRTFDQIMAWLNCRDIEGIVWHHPDGRMVKIKARDFGIKRAANKE